MDNHCDEDGNTILDSLMHLYVWSERQQCYVPRRAVLLGRLEDDPHAIVSKRWVQAHAYWYAHYWFTSKAAARRMITELRIAELGRTSVDGLWSTRQTTGPLAAHC